MYTFNKRAKTAYPTKHIDTQSIDHPNGGCSYKAQEEPDGIPVQLKIHWLGVENGSHKVSLCSVESWNNKRTPHTLRRPTVVISCQCSSKPQHCFCFSLLIFEQCLSSKAIERQLEKSINTRTEISISEPGTLSGLPFLYFQFQCIPETGKPRTGCTAQLCQIEFYFKKMTQTCACSACHLN